jgi:ribosomal protein L11 methyltransferase
MESNEIVAGRCVRFEAQAPTAHRIVAALEAAAPPPQAIAMFANDEGSVEISAHYAPDADLSGIEALIVEGTAGEPVAPIRIEDVPHRDWVTLSQGQRAPVRTGRFLVHGSHDRSRVPRHRFAIEIDAARAFGTAHHASTRGCLLALDAMLKRRLPRIALDLGTGTGVLAIATAKALQRPVLASDNDPVAVTIAAENARKNGVRTFVRTLKAEGFAHPHLRRIRPDLVLANLLERALLELAPILARRLQGGGSAILSGLTNDQAPGIEARYRALGFTLEKRIVLDGWTTLLLIRRNTRALRD